MTNFKIGDKVTTSSEAKANPDYYGVVVYAYKRWSVNNVYVQWPNWNEGEHAQYDAYDIIDGLLIHWTEPVKPAERNPNAPDFALTLDDIKIGTVIRRVHRYNNGKVHVGKPLTITSEAYMYKDGYQEAMRVYATGEEWLNDGQFFLADAGVVSYGGCWNRSNYTIPDTTEAVLTVFQK